MEPIREKVDKYVNERNHFDERAAVIEVGTGGLAALTGVDPVLVIALDSPDSLGRELGQILFHCGFGNMDCSDVL
jgi:hypothetical protein